MRLASLYNTPVNRSNESYYFPDCVVSEMPRTNGEVDSGYSKPYRPIFLIKSTASIERQAYASPELLSLLQKAAANQKPLTVTVTFVDGAYTITDAKSAK